MNAYFTKQQIETLRAEFEKLERVDPASPTFAGFRALINSLPLTQVQQLVDARIPWVTTLGRSRLAKENLTRLYLIEFYTTKPGDPSMGGWDIEFAWVRAVDRISAIAKLRSALGDKFDEVIQCGVHAEVSEIGCKALILA